MHHGLFTLTVLGFFFVVFLINVCIFLRGKTFETELEQLF